METIIVYPKDKEQAVAIKKILRAFDVPFEKSEESPYNPEFVEKIKQSEKEIEEGKVTLITKENQKAFFGNMSVE